ncbi:MAG: hypothetical protein E7443_03025 [Ruminococcaceae bacterium]|nr:hypothetical protein [Oscillospiraceae bacterium]
MAYKERYKEVFSQIRPSTEWEDPETLYAAKPHKNMTKKLVCIAAAIAVLTGACLSAYAANLFGLRDLLLPQQQEVPFPAEPDDSGSKKETYQADMISLAGYGDTPESRALAEWQAFLNTYDQDGAIIGRIGNAPTGFEEDYGLYLVYTQEMADKLDEITAKYGLKLHTTMLTLGYGEQVEDQVGGNFLGENRAYSAYMYEDGTLKFDGEIDLDGYGHLDYQFQRCVRGSFTDMILNIVNVNDYAEWGYVTESGIPVTLALASHKALIIADLPDSFVTINVLAGTETPTDDIFSHGPLSAEDLERFADSFDLSVLTPALPAAPEQPDLAEQQKAELEKASQFYQATGLEQGQAQEFFASFADSVEADDRQTVAEMLHYPVVVTYWNTTAAGTYLVYDTAENAKDFLPFYDSIFTEDLWWNCIMSNRYDKERAALTADNGMVVSAGGAIRFAAAQDGTIKVFSIQNGEECSVRQP